jgi:predicted chitinase
MPAEEHQQRLAQLTQQQAWNTRALAAMAEGRWTGEGSVEAYLLALDPSFYSALQPRVPLYKRASFGCWEFWSSARVARATNCPQSAIDSNWPAIHKELKRRGVATQPVCAAALATIAVETAHTFAPVQESFWLDDAWRHANLRYAPHWGRGYVQLTWDYNYRTYGDALGVDLINNVDRAMEPDIAAAILAEYFVRARVAESAQRSDWTEVRRCVQGGTDGWTNGSELFASWGSPETNAEEYSRRRYWL